MKQTVIIRCVCTGAACLCIAIATTSCGKGDYTEKKDGSVNVSGANTTNAVVVIEASRKLTQVERLEAECRRLVVEPERKLGGKEELLAISELCKEIRNLPKEEALPLLDRWIEMAIDHPLTYANYSTNAKLSERFFHIAFFSFMASQSMCPNPYDHWDKMFCFFSKYTNEITAVEKDIKKHGCLQTSRSYLYLHDLQLCTENWVYMITTVYRDILLDRRLTAEQKADIIRRLDEVKKCTVPPPHSPFSKK